MLRQAPIFCCLSFLCLHWALAAAPVSVENSRSAQKKLDEIAAGHLRHGQAVVLTEDEINSYLRYDYAPEIPAGLTQPHLRFEPDRVIASATVDFLEWQAGRGRSPSPVLSFLLRGKREVEAVCRYVSSDGYGQADVESVTIGGVAVSGSAIEFLIENLVTPRYPEAVVGRRVLLGFQLQQVRIERGRAVAIAR